MRKIVWCCAALAVVAAAAACWTACYAGRHPDSLVGRCVVSGYRMAVAYVPSLRVGEAAVRSVAKAEKGALAVPTTTDPAPGEPTEDADPAAPESHYSPPADPVPAPDEELAVTGAGLTSEAGVVGKIVIQPDPDEPAAAPNVAPVAVEESETPPPVMSHADDDTPVPETMPYAEEESEEVEASPLNFWWGLLQEAASHCTDAGDCEECEKATATHGEKRCPCCEPGAGHHHEQPAAEDGSEDEDGGTQEVAPPPGSDTSEFRPSDATPGDFDSIPY